MIAIAWGYRYPRIREPMMVGQQTYTKERSLRRSTPGGQKVPQLGAHDCSSTHGVNQRQPRGGQEIQMKKGHGSKFSRTMDLAIAALLTHRSVEDAARAVGVSHNTLLRWMKEPEFKFALQNAIRAEFFQSTSRLRQASSAAATTITKIMVDPSAPHACRLRAAEGVIDRTAKAIELEDLAFRLAEVERLLEEKK